MVLYVYLLYINTYIYQAVWQTAFQWCYVLSTSEEPKANYENTENFAKMQNNDRNASGNIKLYSVQYK